MRHTTSACARILLRRSKCHTRKQSRPKSTSTNNGATPAESNLKTIPGPAWLWLEPIATPFRAYGRAQQRRPYVTQWVSTLVIYFLGDISAQSILPSPTTSENTKNSEDREEETAKREWDAARTARALVIGGLSSIPSYRWFIWLGNSFNYSSKLLSISTKVFVNQVLFTPLFNCYFFGMQSALVGATPAEIVERIQHTVPTSWVNSCKLWPAVTAFSFTFVPFQYRSIFAGVIAIGWQTYLSLLNQRAAAAEETEHEHIYEHEHEALQPPAPQQSEKQCATV